MILEKSQRTKKEIFDIISSEGFRDTGLFLPQKIIPGSEDWGILKKVSDGVYERITRSPAPKLMSLLQKRWLKAKLQDPKIRLFMDDDTIKALNERLGDVKPLYRQEDIRYTDIFSHADDFSNESYIKNFRTILQAAKSGEVLQLDYTTGRGERKRIRFAVIKLEYSQKNDKFRAYGQFIRKNRLSDTCVINIGRVISAEGTGRILTQKLTAEESLARNRCEGPAVIRVTPERNGIERFMMCFASYEKHSQRDLETGECIVELWYDKQDISELLIQLLGFGPVIEILGPAELRRMAKERVDKQYEFLFGSKDE